MRARLAAAAALSALAVAALPGHAAAPVPQITDPTGDAFIPEASLDIVSGLFATSGKKVGKKYTPTQLVVTVTYAAAPNSSPLASHNVLFELPGCGAIYLQLYFGGTYGTTGCTEGSFDFTAAVKDKTVTYTVPFNTLGKQMKAGVVLTSLRAYVTGADPVLGITPADLDETFVADHASTTKTYKVA